MTKSTVTNYKLIDLLHFMESGYLAVPNFQRGYKWAHKEVRDLFTSINREYPIGMLIVVEQTVDSFAASPSDESLFPPSRGQGIEGRYRLWLIDGAQRMAALYNVLLGASESFILFYDLRRREFISSNHAPNDDGSLLKMSALFNARELMSLQVIIAKLSDGEALLVELNGIRERFYSYSIPMLLLKNVDNAEIVEIFARMNSSGLSLTKKELADAKKTAGAMKDVSTKELIAVLRKAGYTTNPQGIIAVFPVDFSTDGNLRWIDINADAVRKGDIVPDRPIRVTYRKVGRTWRVDSVAELQRGDVSKALDRQPETSRISPWRIKSTNR
jgi:Protein of unknown function DUF262